MSYFIWVIGSLLLWEAFIRERYIANVKPLLSRLWQKVKRKVSTWMEIVSKKLWHDPTTKFLIKLEEWLK